MTLPDDRKQFRKSFGPAANSYNDAQRMGEKQSNTPFRLESGDADDRPRSGDHPQMHVVSVIHSPSDEKELRRAFFRLFTLLELERDLSGLEENLDTSTMKP